MNQFKNLVVWNKSIHLAEGIYRLTEKLPVKEKYGLTSQINRSVVSIPSNIAEGAGRESKKEFSHFLSIAIGSAYELETQLIIGERLKYFSKEDLTDAFDLLQEIQKMIYSLKNKLN